MYTTKKLDSIPYGNVRVRIYDDGDLDLISYTTPVMIVRDGWLECSGSYWPYSRTTIRHIGRFMREYGFGDYHTAKSLHLNGLKLNLNTGEVAPIK